MSQEVRALNADPIKIKEGLPPAGPRTRRGILSGLAAGSVAVLAACGQTPGSSSGSSQAGQASASKPKGTVQFWHWGVVYNDGFEELSKEFVQKSEGITIDRTPAADGVDYWAKLTAAIAGNVGPDVFLMNTNARTWASQGLLRPVDDLIKKDKAADQANQSIIKSFREWYDMGGKQMGWGWDYSTIATAYNVGHMKEAGLKTPAELGDKWDWNTFREYARKLNRPTASPQRWGALAEPGYETGWLNFVRANGGDYFSEDRKKAVLGSPQAIEALDFISSFVTKDKTAPTRAEISAVNGGSRQMFLNGQLSMATVGDWRFSDFIKMNSGNLDWDVAPVPFKNGKTASSANFRGLVISPQTKVLEAGFEFMKYLLSKPVQDRVPLLFNEVPARLDSAQEVYANSDKAGPPKNRKALTASILATKPLPALDKIAPKEFHDISTPLVNDVWDGRITPKEAFTKAQDEINALIQRAGT